MSINVMLVDDHLAVRSGFIRLLEMEPDVCVVAEASSGEEAIEIIKKRNDIEVVVQDINLTGQDGIETIKDIKTINPSIRFVTLSIHETEPFISRSFEAGADAYLSKRCAPEEIAAAIRKVFDGHIYMNHDIAMEVAKRRQNTSLSPRSILSKREHEIFELLGNGLAVKQVADKLSISPKTVYIHRDKIYHKLGIQTPYDIIETVRNNSSS